MSPTRIASPAEVVYPESDGAPLGETPVHIRAIFALLGALDQLFRDRTDVFVAADIFLYYEEGNPRAVKAPDVLVARGVDGLADRRTFKLWVEGVAPCVIFEVTSDETRHEDLGPKRDLYARLGVSEYFLFDPLGDYLTPPLHGYRLDAGSYTQIAPDADQSIVSLELGARLIAEPPTVRLVDLATDRPILTGLELSDESREQKQRADEEKLRADEEKLRADEEKLRADALEAELNRLRSLLDRPDRPDEGVPKG
jgi:Uma2 family endonuclease